MKNVLLIGGNGFIGSHLADQLLASGHKVRILDVSPERFRAPLSKIEYLSGSFLDVSVLDRAMMGIDVVYHLVSTTVPATAAKEPQRDVQQNLIGALAVLQVMRSRSVRRLVFLSSGGTVYGTPDELPVKEGHPLRPRSSYGIVKAAIEFYIDEMRRLDFLDPVVFRVANPYGPRQSVEGSQGVIAAFLNNLHAGLSIDVWGDGSVVRDFVYVSEVADVLARAATSPVTGVFNVGSGNGISLNQVVSILQTLADREIRINFFPGRNIDVPEIYLDVSAASRAFDWRPSVSFLDGLSATISWMRSVHVGAD